MPNTNNKPLSLQAKIEEFILYCNSIYLYPELYDIHNDIVSFLINWGDWKHGHLRFKFTLQDYFEKECIIANYMAEDVIEEDGSDTYSAIHYYKFPQLKSS